VTQDREAVMAAARSIQNDSGQSQGLAGGSAVA
jgi:hypothetical protein